MKNVLNKLWLGLILLATLCTAIPEKPQNKGKLVFDYANMLKSIEETMLNNKLLTFFDSSSNEIAIVTIPTLEGENIEEYANQLFSKWGIGSAKNNNGVLILVSQKERKVRIEVGYGLEGALPDLLCNQ
ncbi:MAG: TPM domain-containing protein, partial [Cytophagales bacterium]